MKSEEQKVTTDLMHVLQYPLVKIGDSNVTLLTLIVFVLVIALVFLFELILRRYLIRRLLDRTHFHPSMRYAIGKSDPDILYAAQSFANMPDNRRVQLAWGRVTHPNMPFTQMMLFPTEFSLRTTATGIKLVANPIREIETLHAASYKWANLKAGAANDKLAKFNSGAYHIKAKFTIGQNDSLRLNYNGNEILSIAGNDCKPGDNTMEIILDKTSSEIFINGGEHYVVERLSIFNKQGLTFTCPQNSINISELELYEMKSVWDTINKN